VKREDGFTLIELMIVVIVVGILAAIAIPNFMSMRKKAVFGQCLSNQRNIAQGATLYAMEQDIGAASINVSALVPGGYANDQLSECPSSSVPDMDDYTVAIVAGRVNDITCDVLTSDHEWKHVPK